MLVIVSMGVEGNPPMGLILPSNVSILVSDKKPLSFLILLNRN